LTAKLHIWHARSSIDQPERVLPLMLCKALYFRRPGAVLIDADESHRNLADIESNGNSPEFRNWRIELPNGTS